MMQDVRLKLFPGVS